MTPKRTSEILFEIECFDKELDLFKPNFFFKIKTDYKICSLFKQKNRFENVNLLITYVKHKIKQKMIQINLKFADT